MSPQQAYFPALRCYMGDWTYYVTAMPLHELAKRIQSSKEIYQVKGLEDLVQRELTNRVGSIVKYLLEQNERFFNSIIVGVHEGEPEWYAIDIKDSPVIGPPYIEQTLSNSLGIIKLTGEEKMFAIDGQHRVEAIKQSITKNRSLGNEHLSVIFIAHRTTLEGRRRTRRLFSTLNREAKPVSTGEIVALDEDDAFAITVRRLVTEYEGLNPGFTADINNESLVFFGRTTELRVDNRSSITSILALYNLVELIELPRIRRRPGEKERLTKIRPSEDVLNGIYDRHVEFWESLCRHIPEINRVVGSNPEEELTAEYRRPDGGHLLFRPAGQKAFAGTVRIFLDRGIDLDEAVSTLAQTVLQLNERPWPGVLWNSAGRRMIVRNQKLAENLFLFMTGNELNPPSYNLLDKYRTIIGDEKAILDGISP